MADKEYKFIEEQIRDQRSKQIKKYAKKAGITAIFGIFFGIVAAVTMCITTKIVSTPQKDEKKGLSLIVATEKPELKGQQENNGDNGTGNAEDSNDNLNKPKNPDDDILDSVEEFNQMNNALIKYCKSYESTIVKIEGTNQGVDYFNNEIESQMSFYGLILQKENNKLYVLTRYDDIDETEKYHIYIKDGIHIEALPVALDELTGLAVMTADLTGLDKKILDGLEIAKFGNSNMIDVGDLVVAIGKPMGYINSIGYGIVSNEPENIYITDRKIRLFSTDMSNVENGYGVEMNTKGEVIGFITHKYSSNTSLSHFMGISELKVIIEQLMNSVNRGGMGIIPKDIDSNYFPGKEIENGVYVSDLYADSAAMDAEIVIGDIITSIDGIPVKSVVDYMNILAEYSADSEIEVGVFRDYASKNRVGTVKVKLSTVK